MLIRSVAEIKEQILEINKSVVSKEPRHSARALRKFFTKTRRHINRNVFTATVDEVLANENELKAKLHSYVSKVRYPQIQLLSSNPLNLALY
jgi:transcription termination factor NusB